MKKPSEAVEKALDRVVFGSNDPEAISKKLDNIEQYLDLEANSLGHSLAGIRHRQYWSLETVAEKAGVTVETWRGWESDFETPSPAELRDVLERLHWQWDLERFLRLRQKGSLLRLRRLTSIQPRMIAAQGVAGVSGTYEWQSLDDALKGRLQRWGAHRGLVFPEALIEILAGLGSDEEREAWMNEVLDGGE